MAKHHKHRTQENEHISEEIHVAAHRAHKSNARIWQLSTIVLAIMLGISIFTHGFSSGSAKEVLTKEEAGTKTVAFINQNLMGGQGVVTNLGVEDIGSLYMLKLNVNGQLLDAFITKDAQLLFPQVINLSQPVPQAPPPAEIPKTANPSVQLYTMSYCPYGNQAEEVMKPVIDLLKSKLEVVPHYVIYSNYNGGGPDYCIDAESKYCSMHGIQELNEDVRELCIYKYQKEKYWDYVMQVNADCNAQNVDTCWEAVARAKGIETGQIKTCEQKEATALLQTEADLNAQYNVQGSPALIINGVEYSGGRTPEAYKQSICSSYETAPQECNTALDGAAGSTTAAGNCG
ncbi:MAG: hypothetical protein ABIJ34_04825 [archaeon]